MGKGAWLDKYVIEELGEMNWLTRFFALPDLGRWHRYILEKDAVREDQRSHAPEDPCESERHADAVAWMNERDIEIKPLSPPRKVK